MSTEPRTFGVDLRPVPADQATLPVTDLALRRGYGAFDFLRVEDGVPLFVDDHLARFDASAELMGLAPRPTPAELRAHLRELIQANGAGRYAFQLFLTGGDPVGGFEPGTPRTLVLAVDPPSYPASAYEDGVALLPHRFERDLPAAKTTNYFTAVRLRDAMREAGAMDVLYHDETRVLEATRSNLFVACGDGSFATPGRGVLRGITRLHVMRALEGHASVEERDVSLEELYAAPEAFMTSTTKGIMPVVRVGDRTIGDGRPGPGTREVETRFRAYRDAWLAEAAPAWQVGTAA